MKPVLLPGLPPRWLALRPRLSLSALLGIALCSGCATPQVAVVDSLVKPDTAIPVTYEIRNVNPLLADDSLRFKEAAGFVKTALSGKGMYEAPPNTKPDVVVEIDYGVGPPERRIETVQEPIYRTVPGEQRVAVVQVGVRDGMPVYQSILVEGPPTQEFEGYKEHLVPTIVYEKYLRLSARSTAPGGEGKPPPELWTVDVTSEGESRDLRQNLPMLAAASVGYIGKDTKGQQTVKIKDEDVAFIKKGL